MHIEGCDKIAKRAKKRPAVPLEVGRGARC